MRRNKTDLFFFILVLCFVFLILLFGKERREGDYMPADEAENLTWILAETAEIPFQFSAQKEHKDSGYLTYHRFREILDSFGYQEFVPSVSYRKSDFVLKADWYAFFDEAREHYDPDKRIRYIDLTVLGIGDMVSDENNTFLGDEQLLSKNGVYSFRTDTVRNQMYCSVNAVVKDNIIYAVKQRNENKINLNNVWFMGDKEEDFYYFYRGYEVKIPKNQMENPEVSVDHEQIADLEFNNGKLTDINCKTEKISGKLLKVKEKEIELEGYGSLPLSDHFEIYKIYGKLDEGNKTDLALGYDFTDFVICDGVIQAALLAREESMETIRVLIRGDEYQELYHDEIVIRSDSDLIVTAGWGASSPHSVTWPAGEVLKITTESELFGAGKLLLKPAVNTGKTALMNVIRSQEEPVYRGSLELEKNEKGITLINELSLEEYLYTVVPSEMPASYSLEALKAQAVSARTYAYQRILQAGLPELGAHLDDSSAYQVYNNISEQLETTRAVRETKGELLCYGNELAQTYYYSTSCGYGSSSTVWSASDQSAVPYLSAKSISSTESVKNPVEMKSEDDFSNFIRSVRESDFEKDEAWYRWEYTVGEIDSGKILNSIILRYKANPSLILTQMNDGTYISKEPQKLGEIMELSVISREEGGAVRELLIKGKEETYLIKSEYNIRTVLNDGKTKVIRRDGSSWYSETLLPSAFFELETVKGEDGITGYNLYGGGFGHGVGMSQNGARNMAEQGFDYEYILRFFYEDSTIKSAY